MDIREVSRAEQIVATNLRAMVNCNWDVGVFCSH